MLPPPNIEVALLRAFLCVINRPVARPVRMTLSHLFGFALARHGLSFGIAVYSAWHEQPQETATSHKTVSFVFEEDEEAPTIIMWWGVLRRRSPRILLLNFVFTIILKIESKKS